MTPAQRVHLRLAVHEFSCAFGGWVIALAVAFAPLALTVVLIRFAVQRWG